MNASQELTQLNKRIRRYRSLWLPMVEAGGIALAIISVFFVASLMSPVFKAQLDDKAMLITTYLMVIPVLTAAALIPLAGTVAIIDRVRATIRAIEEDKVRARLAARFMRR